MKPTGLLSSYRLLVVLKLNISIGLINYFEHLITGLQPPIDSCCSIWIDFMDNYRAKNCVRPANYTKSKALKSKCLQRK